MRKWRQGTEVFENDWYKASERINVVEEYPHLVDLKEPKLYKWLFDGGEQLFLHFTNKYTSTQKNDLSFFMSTEDLWDFSQ